MEVRTDTRKTRDDFVLYCPVIPERLMALRLKKGKYKITDMGLEQRCTICNDYWPADSEFFYPSKKDQGLHPHCKACYDHNRRMKRNKKVAA